VKSNEGNCWYKAKDIKDETPVYKISNDGEPGHRGTCVASVTTEKTRQRAWAVG
jgi:hypothetical protein